MAGGSIDINVNPNTHGFPGRMEAGLRPALLSAKKMGALIGVSLGAGLAVVGLKKVIDIGYELDNTLSHFEATTGATAAQMAAVGARARELGQDMSLPKTSANDAALAMTELAKGGLTLAQSMDAAKGSLQLAAAAQISAGEAAMYQADCIQAFGLQASDASRVSDIMANTANASTASMTQVAQALRQASAVSASAGRSIEETAAAIGMLANRGIKGSDAGTLLKSALLALQSPSKPAAKAMNVLGLETHNAAGEMLGFGEILDQLAFASKTMTQQEYQRATSILFGSDAARLAGVAAMGGEKHYRSMLATMSRQGTAAEYAATLNTGLAGAIDDVAASAEDLGLKVYDVIRGPLTSLARGGAKGVDAVTRGVDGALSGIADNPVVDRLVRMGTAVLEGLRPIGEELTNIGDKAREEGGALNLVQNALEGVTKVGAGASSVMAPIGAAVGGVVGMFAALPAPVQAAAAAMLAWRLVQGRVASGVAPMLAPMRQLRDEYRMQGQLARMSGQQVSTLGRLQAVYGTSTLQSVASMRRFTDQMTVMRQAAVGANAPIGRMTAGIQVLAAREGGLGRIAASFSAASTAATRFGTAAGLAAASGTALKVAGGGLMGAMGGPFGIAIAAATVGLGIYAQRQADAARKAAEHKAAVDELVGGLDPLTGRLTAAGDAIIAKSLQDDGAFDRLQKSGAALSEAQIQQAASGQVDALAQVNRELDRTASSAVEASKSFKNIYEPAGVSADELTAALRGNAAAQDAVTAKMSEYTAREPESAAATMRQVTNWDRMAKGLGAAGYAAIELGRDVGSSNDKLSEAGRKALQNAEALGRMSPEARNAATAVKSLGDAQGTAADKGKALRSALDSLFPSKAGVTAAIGDVKDALEELPEKWSAAAAAAGGYAGVVNKATGEINLNTKAGRELANSLGSTADKIKTTAQQAYEVAVRNGDTAKVAGEKAAAAIQPLYREFLKAGKGAQDAGVDVEKLLASLGAVPPDKLIEVLMTGGDPVSMALLDIKNKLEAIPPGKAIKVDSLSDDAKKKLEGIKDLVVVQLPEGKGVEITAKTEEARAAIKKLLEPETKIVKVQYEGYQALTGPNNLDSPNVGRGGSAHDRWSGGPVQRLATGGTVGAERVITSGLVRGRGSGTSDSVSALVPSGSHVWTAAETRAAGGPSAIAGLTGRGGRATARGLVPVSLSNGETVSSPDEVAAAGGHDRVRGLRRAVRMGKRLGRAMGGIVDVEQLGREHDGEAYETGSKDCSMWVSWVVQTAQGLPLQRLFTTHTLLGGSTGGLVAGASPSDAITVGTSAEHMAATVRTDEGPVNTESGGNSSPSQVRWGRGAAGAFDSQFGSKFHLPIQRIKRVAGDDDPASKTSSDDADKSSSPSKAEITVAAPPKLEDTAAEAARIGTRGLLESLDLGDSVLADPSQSTAGQAIVIAQNKRKYDAQERDKKLHPEKYASAKTSKTSGDDASETPAKKSPKSTTRKGTPRKPSPTTDPLAYTDSKPYDATKHTEQWRQEVRAALKLTGFTPGNAERMIAQGDIASKGNPGSAGGVWGLSVERFSKYKDAGQLPDDIHNVLANGVAALRLVRAEHGDPSKIWPAVEGYASGGIRPMSGSRAAVVKPGALRVIGDRQKDDEFYIPDTDDPRHVAIGAEWARRRGYQLVSMHAEGGIAAKAAAATSPQVPVSSGPAELHEHYHLGEGDPAAQMAAARRNSAIRRQQLRLTGARGGTL